MVNSVFIASLTYAKADESCFKEAHVSYSTITTQNEKKSFLYQEYLNYYYFGLRGLLSSLVSLLSLSA